MASNIACCEPRRVLSAPPKHSRKASAPKRATSFEPKVAAAFGQIVRAEREKQAIAQDAFALLAHVDRSYFGKLERGERQPSLALLLRIANGLQVSGAELLARVEGLIRKPPSGK